MIYRGTIIEIYHDSIVVMAEDCTFKRIKKSDGFEKGMEIYFEDRDVIKKSNFTIKNSYKTVAAVFIFIVASLYILGFWNENYRSVALLSVDINPSVEIEINKSYHVIKVLALNEEASKLPLENLKNYPLIDALGEIVAMVEEAGYMKKDESNCVLVTSVELKSDNEDDKNLDEIIMEGKKKIEEASNEKGQQVEVVTIKSDKETLNRAKEENISVGKMEFYKEIENNNINEEKKEITELKDKKPQESIKEIKKTKKDTNNENKINKKSPKKENKTNLKVNKKNSKKENKANSNINKNKLIKENKKNNKYEKEKKSHKYKKR